MSSSNIPRERITVAEFRGVGRAMLVAPGKRKITISLPGYQSFETELNLVAN